MNGTIVAVDKEHAEDMKNKFQTYYEGVEEVLAEIKNTDQQSYTVGFRGAQQVGKIHEYVGKIIDAMHLIADPLKQFQTGIDQVMANYAAQDVGVATTVGAKEVDQKKVDGAEDLTGVASFGEGEQ